MLNILHLPRVYKYDAFAIFHMRQIKMPIHTLCLSVRYQQLRVFDTQGTKKDWNLELLGSLCLLYT